MRSFTFSALVAAITFLTFADAHISSSVSRSNLTKIKCTKTRTKSRTRTTLPVVLTSATSESLFASDTPSIAEYTTSTVYATKVNTITSCAPTVTNCPVGFVTTETIALYTTVCPVTASESTNYPTPSEIKSSTVETTEYQTSTVYTTKVNTITSCAATVTDCPVGKVVTETIALYTTVCPVTATELIPQPTTTLLSTFTKLVSTTVYSTTLEYKTKSTESEGSTKSDETPRSTVTQIAPPQTTQYITVSYGKVSSADSSSAPTTAVESKVESSKTVPSSSPEVVKVTSIATVVPVASKIESIFKEAPSSTVQGTGAVPTTTASKPSATLQVTAGASGFVMSKALALTAFVGVLGLLM